MGLGQSVEDLQLGSAWPNAGHIWNALAQGTDHWTNFILKFLVETGRMDMAICKIYIIAPAPVKFFHHNLVRVCKNLAA